MMEKYVSLMSTPMNYPWVPASTGGTDQTGPSAIAGDTLKQSAIDMWNSIGANMAHGALLRAMLAAFIAVVSAYLLYRLIFALIRHFVHKDDADFERLVMRPLRRPIKYSLIVLGITIVALINPVLSAIWEPIGGLLRPALLGWLAYSLVQGFVAIAQFRLANSDDPVATRSRRTRLAIFSRAVTFLIIVLTIGLMLLTIPGVRAIGTTLLASAGLAGLAVGAAAQPALKSFIAGIQMVMTEPLRIGDMVVVDNFKGRVEEINMGFITLRTWDDRAIIIPTTRVLQGSFENWSRKDEQRTGAILLNLSPVSDLSLIRAEAERFIKQQPMWDQRVFSCGLAASQTQIMQIRIAMSAKSIDDAVTLEGLMREHIMQWIQAEMPDALINHRIISEAPK